MYLPFYRRKWKASTYMTNRDRVDREIVAGLGDRQIRTLTRDELQDFLDSRSGLSFSTTDHLRWDLRQILGLAQEERVTDRNAARSLFTPAECSKPERRCMTLADVKIAAAIQPLRERLIVKLAILGGMRPGEIFALRRGRVAENAVDVQERLYRGKLGTPKTRRSKRLVALSTMVVRDMDSWLAGSPDTGPNGWLFASEAVGTPLAKNNAMRRYIRPALREVGLGWVDFHVMRRTHATLMNNLGADPKVISDQHGGLQPVFAGRRLEAAEMLESGLYSCLYGLFS